MSDAGIVLSDYICQLMLVRYGGPRLQMDFVSFVYLMLRAESMEGELVGRRQGGSLPCTPCGFPPVPGSSRREDRCRGRNNGPGAIGTRWLRA